MDEKTLEKLRDEIDELDDKLLFLLNQRAGLVIELGRQKADSGRDLYDPEREKSIFVRVTEKNPGPLRADAIVRLFERIIDESRSLERSEAYEKDKE